MVEWKRSGTGYPGSRHEPAEVLVKIASNASDVRNPSRLGFPSELSNTFNSARRARGVSVIILTGAGRG